MVRYRKNTNFGAVFAAATLSFVRAFDVRVPSQAALGIVDRTPRMLLPNHKYYWATSSSTTIGSSSRTRRSFHTTASSSTTTLTNTRYYTQSNHLPLYSATSSDIEEDQKSMVQVATTTSSPVVVARGTAVSFVPSSCGRSGVMAVKLREEDVAVAVKEGEGDDDVVDVVEAVEMAKKHKRASSGVQGEDFMGKAVQFKDGKKGTVVAQRPPIAFVLCDFPTYDISDIEQDDIAVLSTKSSVSVGDNLLGSIIDYTGAPISSASTTTTTTSTSTSIDPPIFAPIPIVSDIALIDEPFLTGTAMVDALAPIGKGQNMLVIGDDSGVGQREFAIATIRSQIQEFQARRSRNNDNDDDGKGEESMVRCVYALTSRDAKERKKVLQQLKDAGVMEHVVVVATRGGDTDGDKSEEEGETFNAADSAEATAVAGTACSIGEVYARNHGEDSLVIIDDIDQHKELWDWSTRVLVDVFGVDAVVKEEMEGGASSEMRAYYSSLIQRAARFKKSRGGGSMTLVLMTNLPGKFSGDDPDQVFSPEDFTESSEKIRDRISILTKKSIPLTAANLRKIEIPAPTSTAAERLRRLALVHVDDLISMSDGQIWFDEKLYERGQRPAVDAQRSITRVGIGADTNSRADAPAIRRLVSGLRFDFAQAEGNSLEGAGAGSGADRQIIRKNAYLLAMHQEMGVGGEVRSLSENCVLLLAAGMGSLDGVVRRGDMAGTEGGYVVVKELLEKAWEVEGDYMREIDATLDISPEAKLALEAVINDFQE